MSRLRVANLTPQALLQPGKLYALVGEDDADAATLLWELLLEAAKNGHSSWLASPPGIDSHLAQSGLINPVHASMASGMVSVFEADPGNAREVLDDIGLWTERQGDGMPDDAQPGRLVVINGAETLLPALDLATLRLWREHAERQNRAVVLFFREADRS
ncbi:hypothetical protein ACQV5M_19530, partial [Leptospira sp. SA-E8]|uniref:hypothetical protein n=1 Tax=Leptospira sp. SA-E8 TaxID=3422259 RepID=UPI003EBFAADD